MANRKVAAEILEDAARFIRRGWTKYSIARDQSGRPVPFTHQDACFYCIDGAIARAAWDRGDFVNDVLAIRIIEQQEQCRVGTLNDELIRSQQEAVKILEQAAEKLRSNAKGSTPEKGRNKRKDGKPRKRSRLRQKVQEQSADSSF